jgi:2-polyprenyl-6-hydroxyphenyl methylase/3-demethylubiquinone-9 3-methyltransferase
VQTGQSLENIFRTLADQWWKPQGPFRTLHRINPLRLQWLKERVLESFPRIDKHQDRPFQGLAFLDVGSGGGLVSEPLARLGGRVTGVDTVQDNVDLCTQRARDQKLDITYLCTDLMEEKPSSFLGTFDVVIAFEVLEHVSNPLAFLIALKKHLKPGGLLLLSTLNRTYQSYFLGIVAAERLLGWAPKGAHTWSWFMKPSELALYGETLGLTVSHQQGLTFSPIRWTWELTDDMIMNYFIAFRNSEMNPQDSCMALLTK